ncbi:MAG: family 16 glycosylhydrolase [Granulosicoccus sp.]
MKYHKLITLPPILLAACFFYVSAAFALDAPRDLRGTEVRQNTVKWEWTAVPDAVKYRVTVNGERQGTTTETKFYSYELPAGEHVMYLRAIDEKGDTSDRTQKVQISVSKKFKYGSHGTSTAYSGGSGSSGDDSAGSEQPVLSPRSTTASGSFGKPQNPRATEFAAKSVRWEWDGVADAEKYEVFVDGQRKGTTDDLVWESEGLWIGEHSMSVKAIDSSGDKSERSETVKIEVTGTGSGNSTAELSDPPTPTEADDSSSTSGTSSSSGRIDKVRGLGADEFADYDVRWSWGEVSGAVSYEVYVDGGSPKTTTELEWVSEGLWKGTHSLSVKAINSDGKKSERSETLRFKVTGNGSGSSSSDDQNRPTDDEPSAPPPTLPESDEEAHKIQSLIDPESYQYPEVYNKDGWELVFSDEFNGRKINPYRWHTQLRWDGEFNGERYEYRINNGEDQFYVNINSPDEEHQEEIVPLHNPFKFNGRHLSIQAALNPLNDRERRKTHGKMDDIAPQQPFLSGALSTHNKFSRKYGYFEARIKIPDEVGTFPAFWLYHERPKGENTQRTEIDIMENLGHAPHYIYNTFHYYKNVTKRYNGDHKQLKPRPSGQIHTGIDYSDDFHVYAVEWKKGKITWFIDGEQVSELNENEANHEELMLILNLAMGGNWANGRVEGGGMGRSSDDRFPNREDLRNFNKPSLEIDWVRVFKRK